jgi:hypothetical protein
MIELISDKWGIYSQALRKITAIYLFVSDVVGPNVLKKAQIREATKMIAV